MRSLIEIIVVAVIAMVFLFAPIPNYYSGIIVYAAILALFGLSITLTLGYLGYISFGHSAFFGLGAYFAGLMAVHTSASFWVCAAFAIVPGALLGALIGVASMRVSGAYFAIATLTTAEIFRLIASNWTDLTRGPLGVLVPKPRIAFLDSLGLEFQRYYLVICVLCLIAVAALLRRLLNGQWGRAWLAIRQAPKLAESIGISTPKSRVTNIAISGGIASLAGALMVPKILVLTPELFSPMWSATALLVAILGGVSTLVGPFLGGIVFAALPEALRFVDDYRLAIFAVILLVLVRARPGGLVSMVPKQWTNRTPTKLGCGASMPETNSKLPAGDAVEVCGISVSFGGIHAVRELSFKIGSGELIGIIGPNGAGKTTCLNLISGFTNPNAGYVKIGDRMTTDLPPYSIAQLGMVRTFQQTLLCGQLSALDNVLLGTHLDQTESIFSSVWRGKDHARRESRRRHSALECLKFIGLESKARDLASDLPYGEQKMLSIAIALAASPRVLLLDEPAAGLNHTEAMKLSKLLKRLQADGLTVIVIDHNLKMMMQLCDRIVVMQRGAKLADGSPLEIRDNSEVQQAYLGGIKGSDAESTKDRAYA